ncbi:MAG: M1 family metallopeptidase, partial [Candidatus Promineifilaceae bacterium]
MRYCRYALLIFLILLAACDGKEPPTTPIPPTQTEGQPTPESAVTAANPTAETPTETAESSESTTPPETGKMLPASTLFNIDWQDRSPFRAGLIDTEAGVLDQLLGATVYHMDLIIDDSLTAVTGRQEIRYTNQENAPLDAVYYHLFPNLLGGHVEVSDVTVNELPVSAELLTQDSILRVPLNSPLPPGGQVVIGLTFAVDVPTEGGSNYGVFAAIDGVLALAHFYPQVAVYDDAGWDTDIPSENADVTYGDSSFYLVRITAPAEQVMLTSGIITDSQTNGGQQTLTIASGPTRDFYIASSDRYVVTSTTLGQTTVKSYGFPEFTERNAQTLGYAVAAMESYDGRFGTYPFTEFEIGPTPNLALGVEYPGVVVINSRIYDPNETFGSTPSGFYLEGTVAHEVGHQWYYSVIGNNQPDEPWVDESLTQYATYLYFLDQYGESGAESFRQSFVTRWDSVDDADIPIGMPAGNYNG